MGGDTRAGLGRRLRNTGVALLGALVVAWLAWPLIGLLSSWLMLPPDFRPLATLLLGVIVVMAGVAGWMWPEDEPDSERADESGAGGEGSDQGAR